MVTRMGSPRLVIPFAELGMADVEAVGGKNASLGEMISRLAHAGIEVPPGFATTAAAYREFLDGQGLRGRIEDRLRALDADDVVELARCGAEIREWILGSAIPAALEQSIRGACRALCG